MSKKFETWLAIILIVLAIGLLDTRTGGYVHLYINQVLAQAMSGVLVVAATAIETIMRVGENAFDILEPVLVKVIFFVFLYYLLKTMLKAIKK